MRPEISIARDEYAVFLRAEGMKLREIGVRLGVTVERARQIISAVERRERQREYWLRHARREILEDLRL